MTDGLVEPGLLTPGSGFVGYVIEELVGAGGMGVVYRARDPQLNRLVAIKVLSPESASDDDSYSRFLRESRLVAKLDEPHIVPVYAAGEVDGMPYIATRFVEGGDLGRLQRAAKGPLPSARVASLVAQVADALDAAHASNLVHRDVKPANILIELNGRGREHAYLADFGVAKPIALDATELTKKGGFVGTPDYCSPEQVNAAAVDGRADQYSLACVAFSLLTSRPPFDQGDHMQRLVAHINSPVPAATAVRPELPAAVDDVLARGMAKKPAERYGSCAEFATALGTALGTGTSVRQGPSPPGGAVQGTGWVSRRTRLIVEASAAAAILAAAVIVVVALPTSGSPARGGTAAPAVATRQSGIAVPLGSLAAPDGDRMRHAFFSADGKYIAAEGTKDHVYVFSVQTRSLVRTLSVGAGDEANAISFSADDQAVYAIDSTSNKIYRLTVATGKRQAYPLPADAVESWLFGSQMVGVYTPDGDAAEYDAATGQIHAQLSNPGKAKIASAEPTPDGRYMLISDTAGRAYLVDAQSNRIVGSFRYPYTTSDSYHPILSLTGNTVFVYNNSGQPPQLWDRATRRFVTPLDSRWPAKDYGGWFSVDGKFAVTFRGPGAEVVDIWKTASSAHVIRLTIPGLADEEVCSMGPGAGEILSSSGLDDKGIFDKLELWRTPG